MLLDRHTDIDAKDEAGHFPLTLAAKYGRINIAALLIEKGADVNLKDTGGNSALSYATKSGMEGDEVLAKLLRDKEAKWTEDKHFTCLSFQ